MRTADFLAPALLLVPALTILACAGSSSSREHDNPFPDRAEFEAIRAQPAPAPEVEPEPAPDLPEWRFSAPPPARFGNVPHTPDDALLRVLRETQQGRENRYYTAGMHCVAREVAQVWAATGMEPNSRVSDWISRECGTLSRSVSTYGWYDGTGGHLVDGEPNEAWLALVRGVSAWSGRADVSLELGAAAVERDGATAMVVAYGSPTAIIDPVERTPDERGHLVVTGTMLDPFVSVASSITVGDTGRRECVSRYDGERFTIDCRMEPEDAEATLEMSSWEEGRYLGSTRWWSTAHRDPNALPEYRSRSAGTEGELATAESITAAVNRIRREAGLGELRLLPEQTRTNQDLANQYFYPTSDDPGASRDIIALGLMAGWSVGEPVLGGHFRSLAVDNSSAVSAWLEEMLASPEGRAVILQAEYDAIALGIEWGTNRRLLRTLVTTYTLVDDTPREELVRIARARVNEQRRARDRPDARILGGVPELQAVMDSVLDDLEAGLLTPDDATDELFDRMRRETRRPLYAWPSWAGAVNEVSFHETILDEDDLNLLIGVARVNNRFPGHPWGGYLVIVLHIGGAVRQVEGDVPEPVERWAFERVNALE